MPTPEIRSRVKAGVNAGARMRSMLALMLGWTLLGSACARAGTEATSATEALAEVGASPVTPDITAEPGGAVQGMIVAVRPVPRQAAPPLAMLSAPSTVLAEHTLPPHVQLATGRPAGLAQGSVLPQGSVLQGGAGDLAEFIVRVGGQVISVVQPNTGHFQPGQSVSLVRTGGTHLAPWS